MTSDPSDEREMNGLAREFAEAMSRGDDHDYGRLVCGYIVGFRAARALYEPSQPMTGDEPTNMRSGIEHE